MNNEFKGTKGKWELFSESTNSYGVEHSNVGTNLEGVFIEVYTEEHKANALLISKAPELLEKLKYLYAMDLLKDHEESVLKLIQQATTLK